MDTDTGLKEKLNNSLLLILKLCECVWSVRRLM